MKTGRIVLNLRKTLNLRKALDIRKVPNIRKILLPLDGRNGIYRASKVYKDKANGPALDVEEVTILLSTNIKG